jgi:DtxR family transcriptional regulator, Mn-dependent transcriptional regulator
LNDALASPSKAVENFLKAVYELEHSMDRVSTNALADSLGIKAPSVTDMARRMVEAGLINYKKYHGVTLTEQGRTIALQVLRRHRLIELYLVSELGYDLHEVHDEAENLEHAVSDRFIEALAIKLGNPEIDPHGDPIPTADGSIIDRDLVPLSALPLHCPAVVARLTAEDTMMLQYVLDRGLHLNTPLQVIEKEPFDGPLTIEIDGMRRIIGHNIGETVLVEIAGENEEI